MSDAFSASASYLVLPPEAERLVESLGEQPVDVIGTSREWIAYHHVLEKLNLQAHQSAQRKQDNFVVESLLTYKKLPTLVANLLALELWKANVLPLLTCQDADAASLRLYFVVYHEATLTNLLEVACYHEHVLESLDDDVTIELIDYCVRKLTWLIGLPRSRLVADTTFHKTGNEIVEMLQAQSPRTELARQQLELEFRVAVQCVTLVRYVAERLHVLSLSIVSRLLDTHDVLLALAALVENPPWTHKAVVSVVQSQPVSTTDSDSVGRKPTTTQVQWKKFVEQQWISVAPSDLLVLTTTEAQVWLAIYYLLCTKAAREHYAITTFRKDQLLRMRKYMNDLLLDQLPLLADVQRYLDELSIVQVSGAAHASSSSSKSSLVMEAVPYMRQAITRQCAGKYASVAARFDALSVDMDRSDDLRELAEVYQMDGIDELLERHDERSTGQQQMEQTNSDSVRADEAMAMPTRVTLTFHNRVKAAAATTSTPTKQRPLIEEIDSNTVDTKAAARQSNTNNNSDDDDDVVVVDCTVDAATRKPMASQTHAYVRYTLRVSSDIKSALPLRIARYAAADAQIWFDDSDNEDNLQASTLPTLTLSSSDLQLPTPSSDKIEKVWKQIGSLQDASRVVVQCQFVTSLMSPTRQSKQDNEGDADDACEADGPTGRCDDRNNAQCCYQLGALFLSVPTPSN